MEQRKILEDGEILIKTEDGIYFIAMDEESVPLLVDEEFAKRLWAEG